MATCLRTLILTLFLAGLGLILRRKLYQIMKPFWEMFRRHENAQDESDQALGHHLMGRVWNEVSKEVPSEVQFGKPYYMTMGLKRLDKDNWLTIDSEYLNEHTIRKDLLDNSFPSVLQCLPGSELACTETLQLVIDFLISKYPNIFILVGSGLTLSIRNEATKEIFSLVDIANPLELAARLAMEDFNILIKDPHDKQYHLMASATLFPVGWKLQERIGGTMAVLHKPVPQWEEKLGCPVDRYFDRLSHTSTMERSNDFIQTTPALHITTTPFPETTSPSPPSSIILRNERQTFRRLPQSQAILFTVHTFMKPLTTLGDDELTEFVMKMRGWPEEMAKYKGREVWGKAVEGYWLGRREAK